MSLNRFRDQQFVLHWYFFPPPVCCSISKTNISPDWHGSRDVVFGWTDVIICFKFFQVKHFFAIHLRGLYQKPGDNFDFMCNPTFQISFFFFSCGFYMWLNHICALALVTTGLSVQQARVRVWCQSLFSKVQTQLWPDVVCSTSDERNYNYFNLCHGPSVLFYSRESCHGRCTDVSARSSEWVALG